MADPLETVRRLMALALGQATPANEASNAAMQACRMIDKHKLLNTQPSISFHDVVTEMMYRSPAYAHSRNEAKPSARPKTSKSEPLQFKGKKYKLTPPLTIVETTSVGVAIEANGEEIWLPKSHVEGTALVVLRIDYRYAYYTGLIDVVKGVVVNV